ncbi:MAG: GTP-binding protein [Methanomassiliicoccus sp.]|nr:GTP-binding protein [Methanomassiliicoccus sp.]
MIVCQLAGFLGSGKTTLLVRLGSDLSKAGKRVAIIVNEVGEVGVDGAVIDSYGLKSVEITEGCICCSLSGSLQNTLRAITREYKPDIIIIEPTGIALPSIVAKMVRMSMIGEDQMYTICLIDAFRALKLFSEANLFVSRQIAGADIVAINKMDLVGEDVKNKVTKIISEMSPQSEIVYISAKLGDGVEPLVKLLEGKV